MSKTDFNSEFTSPISESVTPISEVKTVRMYLWYKDILKDLRRKFKFIARRKTKFLIILKKLTIMIL